MRLIAELMEKQTQLNYDHKLELKARYIIDRLKQYIESKEDLEEIPSDEDEEESSDEKDDEMKGLSKKEREIMRSIK